MGQLLEGLTVLWIYIAFFIVIYVLTVVISIVLLLVDIIFKTHVGRRLCRLFLFLDRKSV